MRYENTETARSWHCERPSRETYREVTAPGILPKLRKAALYAIAALTLSGILPMALASALIALTETVGDWIVLGPMAAAFFFGLWFVWRL